MRAAYALLGLVVGIVMDEVIRRHTRSAAERAGRFRDQPRPTGDRGRRQNSPQSDCGFLAQDYYDR